MTEVLKAGVLSDEIDLGALAHNAAEQAEEFVRKVSSFENYRKYLQYNRLINTHLRLCRNYIRCGKHLGKFATIVIYQNGFKTIIFCIEIIDRHYHRFVHVSNQYSEFTLKLEIFGLTCWDVLPLSVWLPIFYHDHPLRYNYRKKLYLVPFSLVQLFV